MTMEYGLYDGNSTSSLLCRLCLSGDISVAFVISKREHRGPDSVWSVGRASCVLTLRTVWQCQRRIGVCWRISRSTAVVTSLCDHCHGVMP